MKTFIVSDWHMNHGNIATYCDRPADFTEMIIKRHNERVGEQDTVINLGDVFIGKVDGWDAIWPRLNGRLILVRGNHDRKRSVSWWMDHGFLFACDGIRFRNCWLTHEPDTSRAGGCDLNIHGHLHNIWDGFHPNGSVERQEEDWMRLRGELKNDWQRLFAIEYTDYYPIEFDHFVSHPDKYQARGKHN